jgi:hypothetical protein
MQIEFWQELKHVIIERLQKGNLRMLGEYRQRKGLTTLNTRVIFKRGDQVLLRRR